MHQVRKKCAGGWVAIFTKDLLCYKQKYDVGIKCETTESLSIDLLKRNT